MEFRKECFVNLNIWACDRKHVKYQYCRISDFVVQKPMRTKSISKYHFQHRYMIFFEITRDSYASASLSLSLSLSLSHLLSNCANSLYPEDLRRPAKSNQGHTGIHVFFFCFCCFTSHVNSYGHCGTVSSLNHTFSWAGLSKRLTSNLCTYFRL